MIEIYSDLMQKKNISDNKIYYLRLVRINKNKINYFYDKKKDVYQLPYHKITQKPNPKIIAEIISKDEIIRKQGEVREYFPSKTIISYYLVIDCDTEMDMYTPVEVLDLLSKESNEEYSENRQTRDMLALTNFVF